MPGSKVIYDTSALIEYSDDTPNGRKVRESFLSEEVENLVPTIVFAELVSKQKRKGIDPKPLLTRLEASTYELPLFLPIAKRAGELHAELKKKVDGISLADCIIMAHGEAEGATILTCDNHFNGYSKARILE